MLTALIEIKGTGTGRVLRTGGTENARDDWRGCADRKEAHVPDDAKRPEAAPPLDPPACATCAVRHRSLCAALTSEEIAGLNRISQRRNFASGEVVALEGDETFAHGNVVSGVAKLVRGLEDGREQIVGLLFPSDFMGRPLAPGQGAPHTIQAATKLELCVFPREPFDALIADHPALERKLLERTLGELDAARDWMLLLGRKTAAERVATFLHTIARRSREVGCEPAAGFDLPLTRQDMADFIGLTIETVSRQVTKLRKDGVIVLEGNRRIARVDMARLAARASLR